MKEEDEAAILVRRARKCYGTKDRKYILDDLDMTVKKGTIYGLLGASGCGKTTLLSTIIGRKSLESGTVRVLGHPPGLTKSIGYMPQDIALVGEFTVKGALEHFGWIFGMTDEEIEERFQFLSKLLDLPPAHKLIKNLSGGQQRRVSLAVVLVHDPQLLILDEPTVGLDPVLRQKIWDYLVQIADEKKTIIITTHYIEEANQAHNIGLMRNGKILAEGNPKTLLDTYGCPTIEDVFVHLSRKQMEKMAFMEEKEEKLREEDRTNYNVVVRANPPPKTLMEKLKFTNRGHARALLTKNFLRFKRHPGSLLFAFGFPFLQVSLFFLVIGTFPEDTKVGIVNEEMGNYTNCEDYKLHNRMGGYLLDDNRTCIFQGLACKFVDYMGEKLQNKVYFHTKEEGLDEVRKGNIHQMLYFPYNFSRAVTIIRDGTSEFTDEELDLQEVTIYRDSVDVTLSTIVRAEIYETYKRYAESLAIDCNTNPHMEKFPIVFNDPVHGSDQLTYRDFMAPGMILVLTSFLAMGVSTLTIITERMEGVWDRTLVTGVSKAEILIFHTMTLCCVSFVQIVELFTLSFFIFKLDCKGEKVFAFLLTYLQSIIGICFGILISVVTRNVTEANYASLGLFYPFIILSGCIWPLEGMPNLLRYLSYFVPTTLPIESMSSIIHRGWGIAKFQVFKGFLASFGFIVFFTLASIIILRHEK
ncbi:hypothetical protein RUM43_012596 [Polyplax serrata]|uniref:ABC transporter G family member 23 n=1 Tax=Polyplax serrata TaxID=468196 RepID=A0AAN8P0Z0_POLSC